MIKLTYHDLHPNSNKLYLEKETRILTSGLSVSKCCKLKRVPQKKCQISKWLNICDNY